MELRKRHWAAAFAIAVATHLGLAMWTQRSVHQVQRAGVDQPGIELVLNTALRAAPAHKSGPERPAPTSVADTARTSPAPPPAPETPERRPEADVPTAAMTDTIPVETPRSRRQAEHAAAVQPVEPPPQPQPRPRPKPKPKMEAATPPPVPTKTAPSTASTQKPSNQAAPGRESASSTGRAHAGIDSEPEQSATGASESRQAYLAELQAYLQRHRRYPRGAQLRRQEGTAVLYFVIDRQGNVLDYRIERSSGYRLLDREVAAMLERAKPLPPAPPDLQRSRFELLLPIRFAMR